MALNRKPSRVKRRLLVFVAGLAMALAVAGLTIESVGDWGGLLRLDPRRPHAADSEVRPGDPFPRTVVDDVGVTVTISAPPQRIVTNEFTLDEVVFGIVELDRIIAVSKYSYDSRYSNIAGIVEERRLPVADDIESILSLDPDLVLTSVHTRAEQLELLRHTKSPLYRMNNSAVTLEDLQHMVLRAGFLTGADDNAEQLVAEFQNQLETACERRPPGAKRPRILGYNRSMSYSYGVHTLFHDIVTRLGGINVGAEQGLDAYDKISSEQIAVWNPEWIVTGADPGQSDRFRQSLLNDPAVAMTTAAKKGQIVILPNNEFLTMSHHVIRLVIGMAEALYPEAG